MPRVKPRRPKKFKPDEVVVCWQSFATERDVIPKGARLRGDHAAVQACPHNFVADGTPDAETPSEFDSPDAEEDNPLALDVQVLTDPVEYSEPSVVVLTRDIRVGVGLDSEGKTANVRKLRRGARFLADSEIVVLKPDFFTPNGSNR